MRATNILAVKDAPVPFITFEAPPEVASHFLAFGMVYSEPSGSLDSYTWVLYPAYGMIFDNIVKYMQEFEMTEDK